jgi:hypothetical protein
MVSGWLALGPALDTGRRSHPADRIPRHDDRLWNFLAMPQVIPDKGVVVTPEGSPGVQGVLWTSIWPGWPKGRIRNKIASGYSQCAAGKR